MPAPKKRTPAKRTTASRSYVRGRGAYDATKAKTYYKKYKKYRRAYRSAPSDEETIGEKVGKTLGGLAQKAIKFITGFGDYDGHVAVPSYPIKKNVLLEETNSPPIVMNGGHEFIIRHREYIGEVTATTIANQPSLFEIKKYSLNPGDSNTFPWLSTVAQNFEQYELQGTLFAFKSMYSDAVINNSGSLGTVMMATEYNAALAPFPNKLAMENYEYAQSCKPSLSMMHPIECDRHLSVLSDLYVRRPYQDISGQDIKTYDFGNFYIATQGIPQTSSAVTVTLGELWVTYQVRLLKPKIGGEYIDSGFTSLWRNNYISQSGGQLFQDPTSYIKMPNSNIDVELLDDSTMTIGRVIGARRYLVNVITSTPDGEVVPSQAVGYFPSSAIYVQTISLDSMTSSDYLPVNPLITKVIGGLEINQTTTSFIVNVAGSTANGAGVQPRCIIKFPPGVGAGFNLTQKIIINSIPL